MKQYTPQKTVALWIFDNVRESVNSIQSKTERDQCWGFLIEYAFGNEPDESTMPFQIKVVFLANKPLMRLRGIAGSKNGKSNNPSGKAKQQQLPFKESNEKPPVESQDDIMQGFPRWVIDILTGKTPPPDECEMDFETQKIYRSINPHLNSYLTDWKADKRQLLFNIKGILEGYKVPKPPAPPYVKTDKKINTDCCKNIDEIDLLKQWIQYKKDKNQSYCDQQSINLFMDQLRKLGGNNIEKMRAIIEQARSNNYNGIVPLKSNESDNSNRIDNLVEGSELAKQILKNRGEL